MNRYVMKPHLVKDFLRYGKRPDYFNREGFMDEILEGKSFVDNGIKYRSYISVVIKDIRFVIKKEDTEPFILDNRRIENV